MYSASRPDSCGASPRETTVGVKFWRCSHKDTRIELSATLEIRLPHHTRLSIPTLPNLSSPSTPRKLAHAASLLVKSRSSTWPANEPTSTVAFRNHQVAKPTVKIRHKGSFMKRRSRACPQSQGRPSSRAPCTPPASNIRRSAARYKAPCSHEAPLQRRRAHV